MARVAAAAALLAPAISALAILSPDLASAQVEKKAPQLDFDFVTIGDPGNRGLNPKELSFSPWLKGAGRVNYKYQITRTNVTVEHWFEFVKAYAPYWTGAPNDVKFTGPWVFWNSQKKEHYVPQGAEPFPTSTTWRMAARFMNWLHNDKSPEPWAFENGVYDTSTFTKNPDGTYNDQAKHSLGAKYWIPTSDEYIKSVYWDPNKVTHTGVGGYWLYPDGGDEPMTPGLPWDPGAQTDGGAGGLVQYFPVGSYAATAQSPWGILDASGGERELTEDWIAGSPIARAGFGSKRFTAGGNYLDDRYDYVVGWLPESGLNGIRIATVPAPACGLTLCYIFVVIGSRRRLS